MQTGFSANTCIGDTSNPRNKDKRSKLEELNKFQKEFIGVIERLNCSLTAYNKSQSVLRWEVPFRLLSRNLPQEVYQI
jgi:hypothetical protein